MAKILEQTLLIKLSKIVKNDYGDSTVITQEQMKMLLASMTELAEGVLDDPGIVIEMAELND
jgi:hypothetical protein